MKNILLICSTLVSSFIVLCSSVRASTDCVRAIESADTQIRSVFSVQFINLGEKRQIYPEDRPISVVFVLDNVSRTTDIQNSKKFKIAIATRVIEN